MPDRHVEEPRPRLTRRSLLALSVRGRALDVARDGTIEAALQATLANVPEDRLAGVREVLGLLSAALDGVQLPRTKSQASLPKSRNKPARIHGHKTVRPR